MIKEVVEVTYLTAADYSAGGTPWKERQAYFQPSKPDSDLQVEFSTGESRCLLVREADVHVEGFPLDRVVRWRVFTVDIPFRVSSTEDAA